jgi:signal transduction histidine kinase
MKSDFLNFVSHELRTPLNHIAAVDMIDEEMDQASRSKMVGIVRNGYERLERFIMSSLEYFEWFTPRLEGAEEITNLAERVQPVLDNVASQRGKAVHWDVRVPAQPCLAIIPHQHADQLLKVLADNAVKFSPGTPQVRVELTTGGGKVTLTVTDQGQGFPPAWAEEVFRPFTITDARHHREGTALNLAKVAAMIESYGGRIQARSAGPGQGATFTVELPAKSENHGRVIELRNAGRDDDDLDEETAKAA